MAKTYLYKYRSVECLDRDLKTLSNDSFYASDIKHLNDDQECYFNSEMFIASLESLLKTFPNNDQAITKVRENFESLVAFRNQIGVFSLSKNPCSGMMWALYASERKGYCVIYDKEGLMKVAGSINKNDRQMLNVSYSHNLPRPDLMDIPSGKLLQKLYGTKDQSWSAEEEVRIITDNFGFQKIVPSALHGIIFGSEMSDEDKDKIKKALVGRNITFYQLKRKTDNYGYTYGLDEFFENPSDLDDASYMKPIVRTIGVTDNYYVKLLVIPPNKKWVINFMIAFKEKYAEGDRQMNIWLFRKDTPDEDMSINSKSLDKYCIGEWYVGVKEDELESFVYI